jgi:hypothetical protein
MTLSEVAGNSGKDSRCRFSQPTSIVVACRDCRHRFLVGAQWGRVVLGALTAIFVVAVIVATVLVRQNGTEPAAQSPLIPIRKPRRVQTTLPPGLPPLSGVPAPDSDDDKDDDTKEDKKDDKKSE